MTRAVEGKSECESANGSLTEYKTRVDAKDSYNVETMGSLNSSQCEFVFGCPENSISSCVVFAR